MNKKREQKATKLFTPNSNYYVLKQTTTVSPLGREKVSGPLKNLTNLLKYAKNAAIPQKVFRKDFKDWGSPLPTCALYCNIIACITISVTLIIIIVIIIIISFSKKNHVFSLCTQSLLTSVRISYFMIITL